MIIPEIIKPIIPGTLIGRNKIGDKRMMNKTRENIRTGLVNGASKAWAKWSKTLFIYIRLFMVQLLKVVIVFLAKDNENSNF